MSHNALRATIVRQLRDLVLQAQRKHPGVEPHVILRHVVIRAFAKLPGGPTGRELIVKALDTRDAMRRYAGHIVDNEA